VDARTSDPPPLDDGEPDPLEMSNLLLRVMRGVNGQAFRLFGNRVHVGPFAGMLIPERNAAWDDGNSGAKLLGTYEHELHGAIEHAAWRQPRTVINVGCAEGYYAVGFARLLPHAVVRAFDISEPVRRLCSEYADKNSVADRITIADGCRSPHELRLPTADWPRLYVVDCEGDEVTLLDLDRCPGLAESDIIVECHDFMLKNGSASTISLTLAERFSATHRVELIRPQLPDLDQFQFMRKCPSIMSVLMAMEKRPVPCVWLACWANNRKGISNG
jgi:hypothetical protein